MWPHFKACHTLYSWHLLWKRKKDCKYACCLYPMAMHAHDSLPVQSCFMGRAASVHQDRHLWGKATSFFFLCFNLLLGSCLLYRSFVIWYQIKLLLFLSFIKEKPPNMAYYWLHSASTVPRTVRAKGQHFRTELLLLEELLEKALATVKWVSATGADV